MDGLALIGERIWNLERLFNLRAEAACNSKDMVVVDGLEVKGCVVCRASCPIKSVYKEPDTGIPLKCDFCGEPPNPECVK